MPKVKPRNKKSVRRSLAEKNPLPDGGSSRHELVAIGRLIPSPDNPRVLRRDAAFKELVASIRSVGVLQPLLARPLTPEQYERLGRGAKEAANGNGRPAHRSELLDLRAGHRRLEAARQAGLREVPVIIRAMDDAAAMEATVTENLQRENLSPLEEGRGVQRLLDVGWDLKRIAGRLGKTPTWVARRARLTSLSEAWVRQVEGLDGAAKDWTAAMLEKVAALPAEAQDAFLKDAGWCLAQMTPDGLDRLLSGVLRRLHGAMFSPAAEDLVPDAGSCLDCPKRSGKHPTLFELKPRRDDVILEDEVCLDAACYQRKCDAHLAARVAQARQKHGERLSALADPLDRRAVAAAQAHGLTRLSTWDVEKTKRGDPKAIPAIDPLTGQVAFVRKKGCGDDPPSGKAAAPSAAQTRQARRAKHVMEAVDQAIMRAVAVESRLTGVNKDPLAPFRAPLNGVRDLPLRDALRVAMTFGVSHGPLDFLGAILHEGWTAELVFAIPFDEAAWSRALVYWSASEMGRLLQCHTTAAALESWPNVAPICEILGLDLPALEAKALEAFPEPGGAKAAKADHSNPGAGRKP